jgi:hypothetical protein
MVTSRFKIHCSLLGERGEKATLGWERPEISEQRRAHPFGSVLGEQGGSVMTGDSELLETLETTRVTAGILTMIAFPSFS